MTKLSHLLVKISILNCLCAYGVYATSLTKISYYPKSIDQFILKNKSLDKSQEIKNELRRVLISGHVRTKSSNDTIVNSCAGKKNCFMQTAPMNYKVARQYLFGDLYLEKTSRGYQVKDVYCNQTVGEDSGAGPMSIPNHTIMNCEHSWPQSRFNPNESKNTQKNDLHHLFPVNSRANSTRSNHPFGEVDGRVVNSQCEDSRIGSVIFEDQTTTSFEPALEIRGNIARALFYFSTRYNLPIDDAQEHYLRRWHTEDPVDAQEEKINNRIYEIQNSRNPYIDDQDLVNAIKNF